VIVIGGSTTLTNGDVSSTEIYNYNTNTMTVGPSLAYARCLFTANRMSNGSVFVVDGFGTSNAISNTEMYNPSTNLFTSKASTNVLRYGHTITQLNSGLLLVIGS
jgi:hypothetical protein